MAEQHPYEGSGEEWDGPPTAPFLPTAELTDADAYYESLYRPADGSRPPAPWSARATPEAPPEPRRSGTSPVLIALTSTLVVLALLAIAGTLLFGGRDTTATPTPDPTAATLSASAAPTPSPTPSATPHPVAKADFPAGATPCEPTGDGGDPARSAAGTSVTSCAFAESVRRAYIELGEHADHSGEISLRAWSPVTRTTYAMTCREGSPIACRGGNNAIVYLGS